MKNPTSKHNVDLGWPWPGEEYFIFLRLHPSTWGRQMYISHFESVVQFCMFINTRSEAHHLDQFSPRNYTFAKQRLRKRFMNKQNQILKLQLRDHSFVQSWILPVWNWSPESENCSVVVVKTQRYCGISTTANTVGIIFIIIVVNCWFMVCVFFVLVENQMQKSRCREPNIRNQRQEPNIEYDMWGNQI